MKQKTLTQSYKKMSSTQIKDPQKINSTLEENVNTVARMQTEMMPSVWQEV